MLTVAGWEQSGGGPAPSPLHLAGLPALQRRPRQAPALPARCSALQPHRVPLHLLLEAVPGVCQLPSQAAAAQAPAAGSGATDRGSVQPAPGPPAQQHTKNLGCSGNSAASSLETTCSSPAPWLDIPHSPAHGRLKHHRGLFRGSFKCKK